MSEWRRWEDEEIRACAAKFSTIADFYAQANNMYSVAHRRGIFHEVTKHMSYGFCGFQYRDPASLYVVIITMPSGDTCIGYGITQNLKQRLGTHKSKLSIAGCRMEVVGVTEPVIGYDAHALENLIGESFENQGIDVDGFRTECIAFKYLGELLELVQGLASFTFDNMLPQPAPVSNVHHASG